MQKPSRTLQPRLGEVMELVYDILGIALFTFLLFLIYVNLHMENEKHQGESLPLMWEEGGFLNDFWQWVKKFK